MTGAPELAVVVATARSLIAYSDVRDREAAARLAARAEGRAVGELAGRTAAHEWYAAQDRELAEALGAALARPVPGAAPRWHVCCRACRLGAHRAGCARCEDRARAAFGDPHPGDYPGGPVVLLRRGAA